LASKAQQQMLKYFKVETISEQAMMALYRSRIGHPSDGLALLRVLGKGQNVDREVLALFWTLWWQVHPFLK
jgi:hypothetical protein